MDPLLSEGSETLNLKSFFYHNVKENLTITHQKKSDSKDFREKVTLKCRNSYQNLKN